MRILSIIAAGLLIMSSCGSNSPAPEQAAPPKKDIALQLYSFRDDIKADYAGTIKKVGEMGYTAIEAAGYSDGKFYGKSPEEFKADIEAAGMTVLSSHATKKLEDKDLTSGDYTEALKWWDEAIKAHKAAGMKYIVAPSMQVPKTLKELQVYCDYYNEIGKRCKEAGMKFGYHNHAFEFTKIEDKMMYDYMIENTNPEYVFFQMDVYWVVRGQNSPVDYFNKYKGRFEVLHIKDNKELGQSGMVGFDAIFKNTDIAGTKHIIVEVEKYNHTPAESIKMSLDYLLNCPLVKENYNQ
ncbi:sugar phosphate isomerase/epimerase [Dysgonomonas sp. 511]|uniref:sugar phosphate isomerase/epimerase family protein n=1 Tax=Dysgonomonas sp. 511 TaxID=2302930 RepID=UPI0013D368D9|nr:sugar phosphate isomerase/epimerase [Dysgonomonas sp. 511]NDV78002.1 sugar phosphate isomerase/epimerase [Dysgonomonas sp. 511]